MNSSPYPHIPVIPPAANKLEESGPNAIEWTIVLSMYIINNDIRSGPVCPEPDSYYVQFCYVIENIRENSEAI